MDLRRITGSVLVCCAVATSGVLAQAQKPTFGVIAGATFSKFGGTDRDIFTKTHVALAGGGFVTFGLGPNFAIQPEALYAQKGGKAEESGTSVKVKVSYAEIPVLLKVRMPVKSGGLVSPHVYVGPAIGFKIDCTLKGSDGTTTISGSCDDNDTKLKSTDFSVVFGAGLDVGRAVIDVRYDLGLSKISDETTNNDVKNRTLFLLAGWTFRAPR